MGGRNWGQLRSYWLILVRHYGADDSPFYSNNIRILSSSTLRANMTQLRVILARKGKKLIQEAIKTGSGEVG